MAGLPSILESLPLLTYNKFGHIETASSFITGWLTTDCGFFVCFSGVKLAAMQGFTKTLFPLALQL